ncbi:N-acetylneuraminate synthase family protein [Victivallis sp. Marseille-Q1083]|uniref:N-acetylneuraminate synthase family protein n=1 Tax=Victivallis sp. Marseille-Q1083 TaxID=2717288 RepID=UPI00158DDC1D|nr:N-acetylneuraminate synthase family protein [Victivallis sp. Marseille-Q1083]
MPTTKGTGKKIQVGNRLIGPGEPIFLTGEIGVAHGGSFENARRLIHAAAEAGCDGVDIFMTDVEEFYYRNPPGQRDYFREWHDQSFTPKQWKELLAYGESLGLIVYPTPLDRHSIRLCGEIGVKMINLNSDDVNNLLLLEEAAGLGIPITMHDIDQSLSEVEGAVRTLLDHGARDIIILHSTQETGEQEFGYATANLKVMQTYEQAFGGLGVLAGCVEHTTSDYLIYAVAALQPALISKHIKIDEQVESDRIIAVKIDELKTMVQRVRAVEMALGSGQNQKPVRSDGTAPQRSRNKVLVAARDIPAGKRIDRDDIIAKRPGDFGGLHPWQARLLLGARAKAPIGRNTLLSLNHFSDFPEPDYKFPETDNYPVADFNRVVGV